MKWDMVFIMIVVHAFLGSLALLCGFISALTAKGGLIHRRSGQIFYDSGTAAIVISLIVTFMPGHWNPFLLSIGLFSLYFLIMGFRSVRYKRKAHHFKTDIILTWAMVLCCLLMIFIPLVMSQVINIVTSSFGLLGIFLCYGNLRLLYRPDRMVSQWKRFHIIHMSSALIALSSAFLVVNHIFPSLWNWFLPTVIGTGCIIYSLRKHSPSRQKVSTVNKGVILFMILFPFSLWSQTDSDRTRVRNVTLRWGLSKSFVMDARLSGKTHQAWSPRYGVSHTEISEQSHKNFRLDLAFFRGSRSSRIFSMKSVHTDVVFLYRRKIHDHLWAGGYMNTMTLFNFPVSAVPSFFTNNPIGYHLIHSVGPSVSWSPDHGHMFTLSQASVETALLSYVIQPIFGHPYPEKYLDEDVFDPGRKGMAWPFIKSGRWSSFRKFFHMNIQLGWFYMFSDRYTLGMEYRTGTFFANSRGKPASLRHHDFFLTTGLNY